MKSFKYQRHQSKGNKVYISLFRILNKFSLLPLFLLLFSPYAGSSDLKAWVIQFLNVAM